MQDNETFIISPIAHIYTDFTEKFGIPRQSGLVGELEGKIVFEPAYALPDAVRELEQYSHIWLIWQFSEAADEGKPFRATVRPPRLGGNTHMGVFATRSPFRPNRLGLSCVELVRIEQTDKQGPVLYVKGIDLLNATPIYDIKPYLPYVDCRENVRGGFTEQVQDYQLFVKCEEKWLQQLPEEKQKALLGVLRQDPRPSYQEDEKRIYGMNFAGYDIKFRVENKTLTVVEVKKSV